MKDAAYYNGKISSIDEMTVPMGDRAVYFGDGVYDVAYWYHGKPFLIDEHFDRFYNSCRLVRIEFPYTRAEFLAIIVDLISRLDDQSDVLIYWQASRGTAPRNHPFPVGEVKPNLLIYVKPKKIADLEPRVQLMTWEDIRFKMCNVKTIDLLPNVLASQYAEENGCAEVVQLRDRVECDDGVVLTDVVTEGSHTNVHILKDGKFITAPLGKYILPGIARMHLIQLCRAHGVPVEERYISREELFDADEILISSTTTLVRAADRLDGSPVGGRAPELVKQLQGWYLEKLDAAAQ